MAAMASAATESGKGRDCSSNPPPTPASSPSPASSKTETAQQPADTTALPAVPNGVEKSREALAQDRTGTSAAPTSPVTPTSQTPSNTPPAPSAKYAIGEKEPRRDSQAPQTNESQSLGPSERKPESGAPQRDSDVAAAEKEQVRLQTEIEKARKLAGGTQKNIDNQEKAIEGMGVIDRIYGTKGTAEAQVKADRQLLEKQQERIRELEAAARQQAQLAQEISTKTAAANQLAAAGKFEEAATAARSAEAAAQRSQESSGLKTLVTTAEWKRAQEDARAGYDRAISRISTTETVVQYVDTGVKTVGVVAGTVVAGPAGGAAVSAIYDSAKNIGEQGYALAQGDKTLGEAAKDFALKEVDAAVDAGISYATAGAGRLGGAAVGGGIKGALGIAVRTGAGAVSGAAVGSATEGLRAGYEYTKAAAEFASKNPGLTGAERQKAWEQYRAEHGVSEAQIRSRVGGAAIAGGLNGAAGGLAAKSGKIIQAGADAVSSAAGTAAQEATVSGQVSVQGVALALATSVVLHRVGGARAAGGSPSGAHAQHTDTPHGKGGGTPHPVANHERTTPHEGSPHVESPPSPQAAQGDSARTTSPGAPQSPSKDSANAPDVRAPTTEGSRSLNSPAGGEKSTEPSSHPSSEAVLRKPRSEKLTPAEEGRVSQGLAHVDEITRNAAKAEPAITTDVTDIASNVGAQTPGLDKRLKDPDALALKIERDIVRKPLLDPNAIGQEIPDAIRYTYTIDAERYTEGSTSALTEFEKRGYKIVDATNGWKEKSQYKGLNVVLEDPHGQRFEVQFHTPESCATREKNHDLYEQKREPGTGSAERKRLETQMKQNTAAVAIPEGAGAIGALEAVN